MRVAEKTITYEEINKIPEGYEVVEGELKEMAPTGGEHGFYELKIGRKIDEKLEEKGYVLVGEVGLLISREPLTVRCADIVYISKERLKELPKGMIEVPPDLVIEIISPSNTFEEIEGKIYDYLRFGVKKIILIDPDLKKVTIIDENRKLSIKDFSEEIELIEGIKIKLSEIFGGKR